VVAVSFERKIETWAFFYGEKLVKIHAGLV